jgi:hypothetical protein
MDLDNNTMMLSIACCAQGTFGLYCTVRWQCKALEAKIRHQNPNLAETLQMESQALY